MWQTFVKHALAIAMVCPFFNTPVHAVTVWDPGNYVVNATIATKTALSEVSAATSAIQSVKQTIELIRAATSIQGLAKLAGLEQELGLYQDLVAVNGQMIGVINSSKLMYQDLNAQIGASNYSREAFLQGRSAIDTYRAQVMIDKYDSVNRSMAAMNARRRQILEQVESTGPAGGSITAATQGLSAQVDMLISQNQQTMSLLAMRVANEGTQKAAQLKEREAALAEYERRETILRDAAAKFK